MKVPNLSNEVLENAIMVHETCEKAGMEMQPLDAVAVQAMKELLQYRKIGTVEQCREAVERQKPKRPVDKFTGNEWVCECPVCRGITDMPYEVDVRCIQYCGWCGQRLDWSENK